MVSRSGRCSSSGSRKRLREEIRRPCGRYLPWPRHSESMSSSGERPISRSLSRFYTTTSTPQRDRALLLQPGRRRATRTARSRWDGRSYCRWCAVILGGFVQGACLGVFGAANSEGVGWASAILIGGLIFGAPPILAGGFLVLVKPGELARMFGRHRRGRLQGRPRGDPAGHPGEPANRPTRPASVPSVPELTCAAPPFAEFGTKVVFASGAETHETAHANR